MRQVTYGAACSLDGFITQPNDGVDWLRWIVATYDLSVQAPNARLRPIMAADRLWLRDSAGVWRIHDDIVNSRVPIPTAGQVEK